MDFKVTFARSALRDLEEIVGFIAHDDPQTAQEVGDRLLNKALSLHLFPERHARCPNRDDVRKMPVAPFVIYYRISKRKERVTILHFWHSARQNPML